MVGLDLRRCGLRASCFGQTLTANELAQIRFEQKLDQQLSLGLPFVDESGKAVRLDQYFHNKPVVIVPGYYGCPMLCGLVTNGLVEALQDIKATPGRDVGAGATESATVRRRDRDGDCRDKDGADHPLLHARALQQPLDLDLRRRWVSLAGDFHPANAERLFHTRKCPIGQRIFDDFERTPHLWSNRTHRCKRYIDG